MSKGYIDNMGEYCESYSEPSKKEVKQIRSEKTKWWNSLTEPEREVIKFCRANEDAIKNNLPFAAVREMYLDSFYKKMTGLNPPKRIEKYNFIWNNIEHFKLFIQNV